MTLASGMDRSGKSSSENADVVLGDDWIAPRTADVELREKRRRRSFLSLNARGDRERMRRNKDHLRRRCGTSIRALLAARV